MGRAPRHKTLAVIFPNPEIMHKTITFFFAVFLIISCKNKKTSSVIRHKNEQKVIDTISGFYKTEVDTNDNETCELSVDIFKTKKGYNYHLKTDLRDVKGKVSFIRDNPNELYIVFEGIKWDEYRGDISNEIDDDESNDDVDNKNIKIPIGIDAYVGKDTLTIQNYGNSMNNYTIIGECGRKYILLIKQNHR